MSHTQFVLQPLKVVHRNIWSQTMNSIQRGDEMYAVFAFTFSVLTFYNWHSSLLTNANGCNCEYEHAKTYTLLFLNYFKDAKCNICFPSTIYFSPWTNFDSLFNCEVNMLFAISVSFSVFFVPSFKRSSYRYLYSLFLWC